LSVIFDGELNSDI